jgi:hypothetical protein
MLLVAYRRAGRVRRQDGGRKGDEQRSNRMERDRHRTMIRHLRAIFPAAVAVVLVAGAAPPAAGNPTRIAFDDRAGGRLVITTPAYRLALSKRNGKILELVDRSTGARLVRGQNGCLWRSGQRGSRSLRGGCAFSPRGVRRFTYRWNSASATLALVYRDPVLGSAVVTLRAEAGFFDLRLRIENRGTRLTEMAFPADLFGDVRTVEAGYAPNVLPGVRLKPAFFSRIGSDLAIYPSRWAFADYLALDAGGGHLALYSATTGPIRPVVLGFLREPPLGRCSGVSFCVIHHFQTWIGEAESWTSPIVRIRVGQTARQSILAYRHDNRIDAYPSLETKLGPRLNALAQAPLIKADLAKLKPFRQWPPDLPRLPSPALLHPVAFQPGGHDVTTPDFLPPDPHWGTSADLDAVVDAAHSLGQLVMPYLNVSWWAADSPTMRSLPAPLEARDIAVLGPDREPVFDFYGEHSGLVVSPWVAFVRERIARLLAEWRTDVPADCLFFDQLGARQWIRDFNPASPRPEAYYDGWLAAMKPYTDRCLMVEDGWDRLARDFVGFHGSVLMMAREHDLPDTRFGEGNWDPYPLADWLFHDKVLLYQHDLYDATMTADPEVLTWNMAFGLVSSYSWNERLDSLRSPWLDLVGELQQALGPRYAGLRLADYRELAPNVTESAFGDLVVLANWDPGRRYTTAGYEIAAHGFLARTRDERVVAGAFEGAIDGVALSPGTHYLILERDSTSVTVRQPLGADTSLAVVPPSSWDARRTLQATAVDREGQPIRTTDGELRDGRFVFRYDRTLGGRQVAAYRITVVG